MGVEGPALYILPASLLWLLPAFIVAWIFLRHAMVALLATFAPLPGLFVPHAGWEQGTTVYSFGFSVGLLMAGVLLRRHLSVRGDWREVAWAAAGAVAAAAPINWQDALGLAVSSVSAAGLILAAFLKLRIDEAFIARANRAAESRALVLEAASHIAVPRWALAVSGIGAVIAALGWFENPSHGEPNFPALLVLMVVAFLVAREWRAAAAAGLCAALLWLFGGEAALPFFTLPALLLTAAARTQPGEGEAPWRRALEEEGAGLLFAAATIAVLPVLSRLAGNAQLTVMPAMAFVLALITFPAFCVALWTLLPRRRSVEEMYRS